MTLGPLWGHFLTSFRVGPCTFLGVWGSDCSVPAPLWRILWASVPALTPTRPQAAELSLHAGALARSTPEGSWGRSARPEAPPNAHVTAAAAGTPWGPGAPATRHCRGGGGEGHSRCEARSSRPWSPASLGQHQLPRSRSEGASILYGPGGPTTADSWGSGVPGQGSEVHTISPETQVLQREGRSWPESGPAPWGSVPVPRGTRPALPCPPHRTETRGRV